LSADALAGLDREHPEWRPWLRLLAAARSEIDAGAYAAAIPESPPSIGDAPLVDGATVAVSRRAVERWVRRLLTVAAEAGAPSSLGAAARAPALDALAVLEAGVAADRARLDGIAEAAGADRDALASVAAVAAMPLLHACCRRWSARVGAEWTHGYCPICGAWPVLAEARGLERERRLRCARCGGDWPTEWLRCPFCGNRDHRALGSLAPEAALETRRVETCAVCRRYVKTVTTLTATPAADVAVHDLATVDLDVAALAHGYQPAPGLGFAVQARLTPRTWSLRPAWAA
jgi:FdhE protein